LEEKMDTNRQQGAHKNGMYTGSGIALGAAFGLLFGLLLFEDLAFGVIIGAAAGLVIGAVADLLKRRQG
jgi:uncharacterized membrane protein